MRRKQEIQAEKAGITLLKNNKMHLKEREGEKKFISLNQCFQLFLIIAFMSICILCFVTGFSLPAMKKVLVFATFIIGTLFFVTFSILKKMELFMAIELVCYGIAALKFQEDISKGLTIVLNTFIIEIRKYFGITLPEFQQIKQDEEYYVTVFLCFILFLLVAVTTYLFLRRIPKIFAILLGSILALSSLVVGYLPQDIYFAIFVILVIAILGNESAVKEGYRAEGGKASIILGVIGCLIAIIIVNSFPKERYENEVYTKPMKVQLQKAMKGDFKHLFNGSLFFGGTASGGLSKGKLGRVSGIEFNYDTMLQVTSSKINFNYPMYLRGFVGSIYNGNQWTNLDKEDVKKEEEIEAKYQLGIENLATNWQKLFGEYNWRLEGGSYKNLSEEQLLYEWDFGSYNFSISEWEQENYILENVLEDSDTIFVPYLSNIELQLKNGRVQAENIKGRRYQTTYFYGGQGFQDLYFVGAEIGDFYIGTKDIKKDFEKEIGMSLEQYMETEKEKNEGIMLGDFWGEGDENTFYNFRATDFVNDVAEFIQRLDNFQKAESEYSKYVKEVYTQVPDELKKKMKRFIKENGLDRLEALKSTYGSWYYEEEFGEYNYNTTNLAEASWVRNLLNETTRYTLEPGTLPSGKDFVEYFLTENHKGYCSHYASAGVILLRTMGIPARYVEGYAIPESQFEQRQEGYYTEVKDNNAHAWIEVYKDRFGWVPVEMTPSYYEPGRGDQVPEMPTPEVTVSPTSIPATEKPKKEVTTKEPTVTSKPQNTVEPKEKEEQNEVFPAALYPVIITTLLLFAMIAVLMLRRQIILLLRRRKNMIVQDKAVFYYKQLEKLLHQEGYLPKDQQLRSYEKLEIMGIETIDLEEWKCFDSIINQMAFSKNGISIQQLNEMKEIYDKAWMYVQGNVSRIKRWYLVYIKVFP